VVEWADWKAAANCNSGACVEARARHGVIVVRDSKDRGGPYLTFDASTWARFCAGIREGAFDRLAG
jgi:hypothetical protein